MKWCLWCGENLTTTKKEIGDFCNTICYKEYYVDIGGFEWIIDLLSVKSEIEESSIRVMSEIKGFPVSQKRRSEAK